MYFDMIKDECEAFALGTKDKVCDEWVIPAGPYLLGAGRNSVVRYCSSNMWVDEFVADRIDTSMMSVAVAWVKKFKVYLYKSGDIKQRTFMGKLSIAH